MITSASSTSAAVGAPNDSPVPAAVRTASTTAGWACPRIIGPHEQTRSTYRLPSTSVSHGPAAEAMNRGVPPTALNARTGEFTPPGIAARARANSSADRAVDGAVDSADRTSDDVGLPTPTVFQPNRRTGRRCRLDQPAYQRLDGPRYSRTVPPTMATTSPISSASPLMSAVLAAPPVTRRAISSSAKPIENNDTRARAQRRRRNANTA